MKYEKAYAEVVKFDYIVFMTSSLGPGDPCNAYTDSVGHYCGAYIKGSSCSSWTTPSYGGGTCNNYDGRKCKSYTDNTHPFNSPCKDYGVSCSIF